MKFLKFLWKFFTGGIFEYPADTTHKSKEDLEKDKLSAEILNLSHPYKRNSTAVITAIAVLLQFLFFYNVDGKLAKIELDDTKKQKAEIEEQLTSKKAELKSKEDEISKKDAALLQKNSELQKKQKENLNLRSGITDATFILKKASSTAPDELKNEIKAFQLRIDKFDKVENFEFPSQ